ncbi:cerebral dopamine neurotrophic factor [Callorhinchus milii]|uniref:cerebral dopamine neurotrophic factor n=1 Tax=Callorhinchus milii TaxID=7868 RepID=UPI001C3F76DC|nr:cerebral dopamine neurotrophic factor [Callorhinchus milii]
MAAAAARRCLWGSLLPLLLTAGAGRSEADCEVCIGFLDKFYKYLQAQDVEFTPEYIETELILMCENTRGKENRLCYYIGGTSDAATRIINEVVRPLSAHVPVTNICEKLKKKDSQICELRYDKVLDLTRAKLSTMRVADLKRILDNWSEVCRACAEKSEFVDLILALAPKYSSDFIDPKDDL